ncbi:MAG: glycosyltransferase family 1 protein [Candidatus Peribacteraceae bacterium]|nr:glycosyltransferase family 1 protein [Candidatus Peribacteraceae bacterium]MDD5074344.1 glycosyltransferase family 1 protein [Candidatus Peribacteraceae bacterium]
MLRIAIDVRAALVSRPTGKGQWVRGFVAELLSRSVPLLLLSDTPIPSSWQRPHAESLIRSPGLLWHLSVAHALFKRRKDVIFFAPTSFIIPFLAGGSVRTVPLVHDLIAFRGEPHDRKATYIEHLTLAGALRKAAHICTISEATKRDLLSRYPFLKADAVSVLYAGPFVSLPPPNSPDGRTILTIGTLCPRKNQLRLIRAFARLPDDLRTATKLVLAGGRGWHDDEIVRLASVTRGVEWRGYVADDEYASLLAACTIFAFPSLYEGFGMPVLDALQRGIPVLVSSRGSLPEVAGDAALFVDPEDETSIAKGLETLLRDEALRSCLGAEGRVQARKFSWKNTVDLFLSAVQIVS